MSALDGQWRQFARKLSSIATAHGVMSDPFLDEKASRLVEGDLQIDLLNIWHQTAQLTHRDSDTLVQTWISPSHLGHVCYFGRVDVVERHIATGLPLDGEDYGGNPIAAAVEAWVVTPLHVRCVELLFDAGAASTMEQFNAWNAESVGSLVDLNMLILLVKYGRRSSDSKVREKATSSDLDEMRRLFASLRAGQDRETS